MKWFIHIIEEKIDTSSEDIEFLKGRVSELKDLENSYEIDVGEAVYELEKRIEKLQYEEERRKDAEYYDEYPEGYDDNYNWVFWTMLTPQLCFRISVYGKTI